METGVFCVFLLLGLALAFPSSSFPLFGVLGSSPFFDLVGES
jgi:hypothetical protein